MIRDAADRSPLASLTATIRSCSASRRVGLGLDRRAGAARDVVEHHRQVGGVGDRCEVRGAAPAWRGLVVVRRHEQQRRRRRAFSACAGQLDRVRGVVGADPGDDAGPVADRVDDGAQDRAVLLGVAGGRRLPRRAADDQAVVAVVDEVRRRSAAVPSRSTEPSSWKAVTIAVSTRPNGRRAGSQLPDVMGPSAIGSARGSPLGATAGAHRTEHDTPVVNPSCRLTGGLPPLPVRSKSG